MQPRTTSNQPGTTESSVQLCDEKDEFDGILNDITDFCKQGFENNTEVCGTISPVALPEADSERNKDSEAVATTRIWHEISHRSSRVSEAHGYTAASEVISEADIKELATTLPIAEAELKRLIEVSRNCNLPRAYAVLEELDAQTNAIYSLNRIMNGAKRAEIQRDLRDKPNFWAAQNNPSKMNEPYTQLLASKGIYNSLADLVKHSDIVEYVVGGMALGLLAISCVIYPSNPIARAGKSMFNTVHNWFRPGTTATSNTREALYRQSEDFELRVGLTVRQ